MESNIPSKSSRKKLFGAILTIVILVSLATSYAVFSTANNSSPSGSDRLGVSISPDGSSFQLGVNTSKTFTAQAFNGTSPYNYTWTIAPTGSFNISINGEIVTLENDTNIEVSGQNLTLKFPYAVENEFVQVYVSVTDANGLEGKSGSILIADPYSSPGYKFDASTASAKYIVAADG
ncbi:MAG: hypothetical protein M1490_04705, partial [Candidatus Bathyarchaeota archaeon]|nr:hypothetical protein [Candidatus Bathyarchaeota archaeon]